MSVGLDCLIEIRNHKTKKWEKHDFVHREPLAYEYAIFSYDALTFLTGHKNHAMAPTIGEDKFYRGYPSDSDWLNQLLDPSKPEDVFNPTMREHISNDNDYAISWVTLKELLDFDYDQNFEDLSNPNYGLSSDRRRTLGPGEGRQTTVRKHMGEYFFNALDYLKSLGEPDDVRIIYNLS